MNDSFCNRSLLARAGRSNICISGYLVIPKRGASDCLSLLSGANRVLITVGSVGVDGTVATRCLTRRHRFVRETGIVITSYGVDRRTLT